MTRDVAPGATVAGNPARVISSVTKAVIRTLKSICFNALIGGSVAGQTVSRVLGIDQDKDLAAGRFRERIQGRHDAGDLVCAQTTIPQVNGNDLNALLECGMFDHRFAPTVELSLKVLKPRRTAVVIDASGTRAAPISDIRGAFEPLANDMFKRVCSVGLIGQGSS